MQMPAATLKPVKLRSDVAKGVIAQFPEFTKLIKSSMEEYKHILGNIISSDDESIKQVYAIADKDMDHTTDSKKQFYNFAEKVRANHSKLLDNPDLTAEEHNILAQDMEILKAISEKNTEIRTHETWTVKMVNKKDSEKRQFNWGYDQGHKRSFGGQPWHCRKYLGREF